MFLWLKSGLYYLVYPSPSLSLKIIPPGDSLLSLKIWPLKKLLSSGDSRDVLGACVFGILTDSKFNCKSKLTAPLRIVGRSQLPWKLYFPSCRYGGVCCYIFGKSLFGDSVTTASGTRLLLNAGVLFKSISPFYSSEPILLSRSSSLSSGKRRL